MSVCKILCHYSSLQFLGLVIVLNQLFAMGVAVSPAPEWDSFAPLPPPWIEATVEQLVREFQDTMPTLNEDIGLGGHLITLRGQSPCAEDLDDNVQWLVPLVRYTLDEEPSEHFVADALALLNKKVGCCLLRGTEEDEKTVFMREAKKLVSLYHFLVQSLS